MYGAMHALLGEDQVNPGTMTTIRVARQFPLSVRFKPIVAIAADTPLPSAQIPVIGLDDVERIADILLKHAAPVEKVLVLLERR